MITAVRPASTVRMACCTACSPGTSSEDVASSRIRTAGSASSARANATSWRWPAEIRPPRLRTSVSKPSGRAATKSYAPISRAARSTSSRVAPGLPMAMFSATVPENRKDSWVTITTPRRRSAVARSRRSTPSRVIRPSVGS